MGAETIDSLGRHVQARVTQKEFDRIKSVAGHGRGELQKFARRAIMDALDRAGEKQPYPYVNANRELHEKLETILNSGDEEAISAVVPNIELLFNRRRPKAKRASGKPGGA